VAVAILKAREILKISGEYEKARLVQRDSSFRSGDHDLAGAKKIACSWAVAAIENSTLAHALS